MINISHILEGWGNKVKDKLNLLDEHTKKISQQRLLICDGCSLRVENSCSPLHFDYHIKTGELTRGCGCKGEQLFSTLKEQPSHIRSLC